MEVIAKPRLHQDWIDSHAFGIVKALQKSGFTSYLVGGCVRDLMLGIHPKDYDIATAAHPPQVKKLIYMAFVIGKRFRLVLVKRDDQQFEVATFRREVRPEDLEDPNAPQGDNIFGSPEEDAQRRDFTVNGLFYDPVNEQLIDYVNGVADINARILRMIGDPNVRLLEDPIRTLRGIRLAHKLGMTIEPTLREAMQTHAESLGRAVLPRKREEILKILRLDEPDLTLLEFFDLGILKFVIPTLDDFMQDPARREVFLEHFNAYRGVVTNFADPAQLFGWITFAMLQAANVYRDQVAGSVAPARETSLDEDGVASTAAPSAEREALSINDEVFQRMMREELGMYKFEQSAVSSAIELLPNLQKTDEFRRRGERRQFALMKNEGFRLALQFAVTDFQLSPEQFKFWETAFEKMSPEIEAHGEEAKSKRRRRPRRRRPGGERPPESGASPNQDPS